MKIRDWRLEIERGNRDVMGWDGIGCGWNGNGMPEVE